MPKAMVAGSGFTTTERRRRRTRQARPRVFDTDAPARIVSDHRRFGSDDRGNGSARVPQAVQGPWRRTAFEGIRCRISQEAFRNKTPIKAALLDQRVIAGLGNIYVCEALWRSAFHHRRLRRLRQLRLKPSYAIKGASGSGEPAVRRCEITARRMVNWLFPETVCRIRS